MKRGTCFEKRGFIGAVFLVVLTMTVMLSGMTASAAVSERDAQEASYIVRNLRSLKSAVLMAYMDDGEWLHDENHGFGFVDVTALERYLGGSLTSVLLAGGLSYFCDEHNIAGEGVSQVFYGYHPEILGKQDKPGVAAELEDMAKTAFLFGSAANDTMPAGLYRAGHTKVWIAIKSLRTLARF